MERKKRRDKISLTVVALMVLILLPTIIMNTTSHPHPPAINYKWPYLGDSCIDLETDYKNSDLTYVIRGDKHHNRYWIDLWEYDPIWDILAPDMEVTWTRDNSKGYPVRIAKGELDYIWIVTTKGTLFKIDYPYTHWIPVQAPVKIRDIACDKSGNPWIISDDGRHLYQMDNNKWVKVDSKNYDFFFKLSLAYGDGYIKPWIISKKLKIYEMKKSYYSGEISWIDRTYNAYFGYDIACTPDDNENIFITGRREYKWGCFILKWSGHRSKSWIRCRNGLAYQINIGSLNRPYVINSEGKLFYGEKISYSYTNSKQVSISSNNEIPTEWTYLGKSGLWGDLCASPTDPDIVYAIRQGWTSPPDTISFGWIEKVNKNDGSYEVVSTEPDYLGIAPDYPSLNNIAVSWCPVEKKEHIWVVNTEGTIYKLVQRTDYYYWEDVTPDKPVKDVAAGFDGSVWTINGISGNYIYKWNRGGSTASFQEEVYLPEYDLTNADKLTVTLGTCGYATPWIVVLDEIAGKNEIYEYEHTDMSTGFERRTNSHYAVDIGASLMTYPGHPNSYVYIVGDKDWGAGWQVFLWRQNVQSWFKLEWNKYCNERITVGLDRHPWTFTDLSLISGKLMSHSSPEPEPWTIGETYYIGDLVTYNHIIYECLQTHTAYASNWTPPNTPALWKRKY